MNYIASVSADGHFESKNYTNLDDAKLFLTEKVKHFEDNGFKIVQRDDTYVVLQKPAVDDICVEIIVQICREIDRSKGRKSVTKNFETKKMNQERRK